MPITFNLVAQRPGSFESLYEIGYQAAVIGGPVAGGLAMGAAGNLLHDLFKVVYGRVIGGPDEPHPASVVELEEERGGDVAALVEAVEPSVRLAHNVINHGVMNINIHAPAVAPAPIVNFNSQTKQYMWESVINNDVRLKLFSMASFNANQGNRL